VPTANHAEFVVAALRLGKHVFCESPFALRLPDSEAMLEAAKQAGRIFLVGLLERSIAQYEHVHEAASAGHLGKVLSITTYRLGSYLLSEETRKHYADPALELMTLDFDFIRWMIGPPASVYATALETPGGVPGEISAILNYDSRVSATVLASGIMPKRFPFSIGFRLLFEKGAFELKTVFEQAGPPKNLFQFLFRRGRATLNDRGARSLRAGTPAFCKRYPRQCRPRIARCATCRRSPEIIARNAAISERGPSDNTASLALKPKSQFNIRRLHRLRRLRLRVTRRQGIKGTPHWSNPVSFL
jgi:predicted dehydrogenase